MAAELADTLRAILGNDDASRKVAEARFTDARKTAPAATVGALFALLAGAFEEPVKEQGAVLLRQCLSKVEEAGSTWSSLDAATQAQCKAQLLQLFATEQTPKVSRKIADALQALGNQTIYIEEDQRPPNVEAWPELIPTLMQVILDPSKDANLRADALWAVKELLTSVWQVIMANAAQTEQLIKTCLADPHPKVCSTAAQTLWELIDNLQKKADRQVFVGLKEGFCQVVQKVAELPDNTEINKLLTVTEVNEGQADFFKDGFLGPMLPMFCAIAKSHPSEETRRLALEVVCSFVEAKPKAVAKQPQFIEQSMEVCIQFLQSELGDDLDEWAAEDEDEAEDGEMFKFGKEVVNRISSCVHKVEMFNVVLGVLRPAIATMLQSPDWKHTVVCLTLLAQIVEYVDDESAVVQMLSVAQAQLVAANVRVRYAAWICICQFSVDQSEIVVEESRAQQLLPLFLQGLDDPCERVLLASMEAFTSYGQECEREVLDSFVQPMMEKLGLKLQAGKKQVQKKAITYIAVLAAQLEDGFATYYDPLMPILKMVVENLAHKTEERVFLGKAFECIGLLAKAVGPVKFQADAAGIMQAMTAATQVPNLPNNDPVKEYMLQASQRICETMKGDFVPYVQHLLPGILEKLTLAPKELNDQVRDSLEGEEVNITITQEDGKMKLLFMSTSEMEDLSNALECVHTYVTELGKLYAPFVADTAKACLPVFDFSMAEEIRDLAFETWGQLCTAARDGGHVDVLVQLVQEFLKTNLPKLETSADPEIKSLDIEEVKTRADGVKVCLQKAGPSVLTPTQVQHILRVAFLALDASFKREQKGQQTGQQAADEDDGPAEDMSEDELAFRVACCEIPGALMQHHPDAFVSEGLPLCMPLVQQLIPTTVPTRDRKLGIYLACDFVDHLGTRVTSQWPQFMPIILQDILHQDPDIRQPACFFVSCAAKDPAFAPMAAETAHKLVQVVTQTRSREKKKSESPLQGVADNALSAIVELLLNHSATLASGAPALWDVWLQGLPCQTDEDEGKRNHGVLLRMVQSEKPEVIGEGGANLPKVLSILVDVYKTDMVSEETSRGIGQFVVACGARLEQFSGQLKEKQRKKLMRIHREAQQ